jgi:ABC-type phosphate/phosphonate transport system substrate-binding protein
MFTRISLLLAAVVLAAGPGFADDKTRPKADAECCCQGPVLKIGAVAYGPSSVNIFRGIRYYFARNKMPVEFVLYSTYDALNEALEKGQVDLAWNSPLGHARYHLKAGDSQTVVMRDADVNYRVKLVAVRDAGVASLGDVAGKTMVFGSCDSADSTVLPVYYLKRAGVDFGRIKVLSLHDEVDELGVPCHSQHHVLAALLKGRGQVGIIGEDLWHDLKAKNPDQAARLKEVWTSPPFSHCVFTARKDFDKETAGRFQKLMVAMDGKDPVTAEVLKLEHCTRWVPAGKEAQDGYADLLNALREPGDVPVSLRK